MDVCKPNICDVETRLREVAGAKVAAESGFNLTPRGAVRLELFVSETIDPSRLSRLELEALALRLHGEVAELKRVVGQQRHEIARLNGASRCPKLKPSEMDTATTSSRPLAGGKGGRRGASTVRVAIEEQVLTLEPPAGSRFKGYETYLVQDLVLRARAVGYLREGWLTPAGWRVVAPLSAGVRGHFVLEVRRLALLQQHHAQITVERLTGPRHSRR